MTEKFLHIKRLLVFEHKVYGTAEFMGDDSQSLALISFISFKILKA